VSKELLVLRWSGASSIQLVPSQEPIIQSRDFSAPGFCDAGGCAHSRKGNTASSKKPYRFFIAVSGRLGSKDFLAASVSEYRQHGKERPDLPSSSTVRSDKTPLELFVAGVRGWEAAVRRRMTGETPAK